MPVFHEQAIRLASGGKDLSWLQPEHLADWRGLAAALDQLCPEQRSETISADWRLRLGWRVQK
jgi:hypothetical protein